jgi:hypothetical protein
MSEHSTVNAFIIEESAKYKGLTIRERAKRVVAEMGETGQIIKVAWMMEIEKALYAMVMDCADAAEDKLEEYWWRGRVAEPVRELAAPKEDSTHA